MNHLVIDRVLNRCSLAPRPASTLLPLGSKPFCLSSERKNRLAQQSFTISDIEIAQLIVIETRWGENRNTGISSKKVVVNVAV